MKKVIFTLLSIVMVASFSNKVVAQTTATATNNAQCSIIAPIGITAGADLWFGDIIKGAGDVVVDVNGDRTIPAALKSGTQLGTINAAVFNVTGEALYTYTVTLPADAVVTITEGTDPMNVNGFNCKTATTSATDLTGALDASGDDVITVGATVTVDADQVAGDYTGTFDVIVAYN